MFISYYIRYHRDIGANTDVLFTLGYSYEDTKTTNISSSKLEYHAASLGIRQSLTDTIEAEIQYALMNTLLAENNLLIS